MSNVPDGFASMVLHSHRAYPVVARAEIARNRFHGSSMLNFSGPTFGRDKTVQTFIC